MKVLGEIPLRRLGWPPVALAWHEGGPVLREHLPPRPKSLEALLARAEERIDFAAPEERRAAVAETMARYAAGLGAPPEVEQNLELFARPGTMAVVTGQQPALFGGPIYLWHKVATVLHLVERIRRIPGAPAVVPLFWNHSEDHDWGEANHSYLVNPSLDVQRIRLALPTTGKALYRLPVGASLEEAIAQARDLLPATDRTDEVLAGLRPGAALEHLGRHLARQLFRWFGKFGLLVLEPCELPIELRAPLLDWHAKADRLRTEFKALAAELEGRGLEVPVDPNGPFLFQIDGEGRRRALADGQPPAPERLASPGLFLRCVWQDQLLPVLAYAAGPGEVTYLSLAGPFYRLAGVPRPPLLPRASMTHVERRLAEMLARWEIPFERIGEGAAAIERWIAEREGAGDDGAGEEEPIEVRLEALGRRFAEELHALEEDVAEVDRNLAMPVARFAARTRSELKKLAEKVRNQRRNKAGTFRQHARRLCAELRPRGAMQERVFSPLPYLVRHGRAFADGLVEVADPFRRGHLLVCPDAGAARPAKLRLHAPRPRSGKGRSAG